MAAHVRNIRNRRRRQHRLRKPRLFLDRTNPLEIMSDDEVFDRYRFRRESIYYLLNVLPIVESPTLRNCPLPPLFQLLLCLRFFATGSLQMLIGDSLNVSRQSTGKFINYISKLIVGVARQFINFPVGAVKDATKDAFAKIAGFPNVVGCIDGTFIRLQRPKQNEADYVNRKGYHSLNVQMCCDASFRVTSVSAKWPGSVHDSRVFRNCTLRRLFEDGHYDGYLLGDSGYPCRKFLLTPLLNPTNPPQQRYNNSLCKTRVIIEQTFGILKRRCQCLHNELRVSPQQAIIYVIACVVLHNISIDRGELNVTTNINDRPTNNDHNDQQLPAALPDGVMTRNHIIQTFFT